MYFDKAFWFCGNLFLWLMVGNVSEGRQTSSRQMAVMSMECVPAAFGQQIMMQSMESGVDSLCTTFQMISGLTEASGRSAEVWESGEHCNIL